MSTLPNIDGIRPTLLAVLAHPDDESFGIGGTLAAYAWMGAHVHLICATGGEEGAADPEFLVGYPSLAARREAELACAAQALGLTSVTLLGYRDSGMPDTPANHHPEALAAQPLEQVIARVVEHIRRLRPHVVVTFDPIGGYRHPDHIAIHQATVAAFYAAGDPARFPGDLPPWQPQKLYFQTIPRRLLRIFVRLMPFFGRDPRRFGRNHDVDLVSLAEVDFPVHAQVDYLPMAQARMAAARCHASQGGTNFGGSFFAVFARLFGGRDTFMRAYPEPEAGLHETDLFAGVSI
ncbi:PIG-L family deacetylase [Candidatus Chloroploca sp. Khr17]|uniref:PIG-L family deacetylase n=1 Tax=Candidatus Chloroploca sp. Khr17 TaxID=2496869 RepID=UPI00101D1362|nr:PIG-L family deacetylase [Candidatus Chloroploca sp. Khr17]